MFHARLGTVIGNCSCGKIIYFKSYNSDSRVSTGGISFQKNMHIPRRVLEIMEEYRDVKYIDELAFQCIHAEWFGSLSSLHAMQLPVKEL